jgi:hypothetical protein
MANITPHNRSFYNHVMGVPAPPQKGQRVAGEGMVVIKTEIVNKRRRQLRDVLRVLLETESGDPEEQKKAFYEKHLKTLNKSELDRLMKKIHKIAAGLMEEEQEILLMLGEETIRMILDHSEKLSEKLLRKILKQLKKFHGLIFSGHNELSFKKKKYTFHGFVKEYFSDITEEYDHLVQEGQIVPNRSEKMGVSFVKHAIRNAFPPELTAP